MKEINLLDLPEARLIPAEQMVEHLVENHYPELKDYPIHAQLRLERYDSELIEVNLSVGKEFGFLYLILGHFPENIEEHPDSESILRGGIAHELSHVVLGHCDAPLFSKMTKLPEIGKNFLEFFEKETDMETIKRGLGRDLYNSALYMEQVNGNIGKVNYTSEEIIKILE